MNDILESILPYTAIVGQEKLKLALELAVVAPGIGGVLISGRRGTAKSTTVRAFASMLYQDLPVTIPINATEDRVIGGWNIDKLMQAQTIKKVGLIEQANGKLLYIDEVNLLDDHIVNILLDVTSTGKLIIQREGLDEQHNIELTLVGTMNPEEGTLRPQLLDRFGLMIGVEALATRAERSAILTTVLDFEEARRLEKAGKTSLFLTRERLRSAEKRASIEQAKKDYDQVKISRETIQACARLSEGFKVEGHRADYLLALASKAYAALQQQSETNLDHLLAVAELVLRHRLPEANLASEAPWGIEEEQRLVELVTDAG